jgi:hypothetical protein
MWSLLLVLYSSYGNKPVTVTNFATANACLQTVEHMKRDIDVAYCVDTQTGDVIEAKP